jgi:uncharacterized protein (TIGR03083 family)
VVRLLEDDVAGVEVPTCPGWTIRDMAAHLAGFFGAYKTGKGMEAFGEGWAEREIDARKDKSFRECIEEWTEHVRDPGDLFESPLGPVAVADVLAHEQDIRTALNVPGARDDESIVPSVEMALSFLGKKAGDELPTLKIVTEDLERQIGDGEPAATLRTSTFELFRTLHGRRTIDQIRALDWEGDAEPWTTSLFIFGPTKEVVETS